jgi:hypothetical protein
MSLRAALDGYLDDGGELELDYAIGDTFSGRTELRLSGDGAYRASSTATAGREPLEFTGSVDAGRVRDVVAALVDARVWEAGHVRSKPGEDDPEATIAARSPQGAGEVTLWVSEIRRVPPFAAGQEALLGFVRAVSDGRILEAGR